MIRPRIGFSEAVQEIAQVRTLHRVQRRTHGHASSTPPPAASLPLVDHRTVQPLLPGVRISSVRCRAQQAAEGHSKLESWGPTSGSRLRRRVRPRRARARGRGRRQPRSDGRARDTTRCGPARPPPPGGAAAASPRPPSRAGRRSPAPTFLHLAEDEPPAAAGDQSRLVAARPDVRTEDPVAAQAVVAGGAALLFSPPPRHRRGR